MRLRRILHGAIKIAIPFLIIITFFMVHDFLMNKMAAEFKVAVKGEIPGVFPVLVVSPGEEPDAYIAKVVYYEDLQDYLRQTPNH